MNYLRFECDANHILIICQRTHIVLFQITVGTAPGFTSFERGWELAGEIIKKYVERHGRATFTP